MHFKNEKIFSLLKLGKKFFILLPCLVGRKLNKLENEQHLIDFLNNLENIFAEIYYNFELLANWWKNFSNSFIANAVECRPASKILNF